MPFLTMSYDTADKTELEYEFLYNLRDQALLFLKMQPETDGYVNEILARLDEIVETLQERLAKAE